MKNTIITLASVATLAVTAHAQTIIGNSINSILSVNSIATPTGGPNNIAGLIDGIDGSNGQGVEWANYTTDKPFVVLDFSVTHNITNSFVAGDYAAPGHSSQTFQLEFFSGTGATGSSVGIFNLNGFNDQALHGYSTIANNVKSVRWTPTSGAFAGTNAADISEFQFSGTTVPEPSSTALLGLGALGLLARRKR